MRRRIRANHPRRIARDEGGAMMVLGVFVSMFLVGALWSIAGLGEAVVMRERMQEAADATAMAAAVIDARAMNVIVLLNLIMAAILSIRVLLNGIIIGAGIVGAFFAALAAIPFVGLAFAAISASAFALAAVVQIIHDNVNPSISKSMTSLEGAMNAIAQSTPQIAARAGGIPALYTPPLAPIQTYAATGAGTGLAEPLPVTLGSSDSLCTQALNTVQSEVDDIMNQSAGSAVVAFAKAPIDIAIPFVVKIVKGTGFLYNQLCEFGGTDQAVVGGAATDLGSACGQPSLNASDGGDGRPVGSPVQSQPDTCINSAAPNGADQIAVQNWMKLEPEGGPELDNANQQLQDDTSACNDYLKNCNNQTSQQATTQPPPVPISPTTANNQPFVVDSKFFQNGGPLGQIYTQVSIDLNSAMSPTATMAPKLVSVAARGQAAAGTPPAGYDTAVSQAEFFYDCVGDWGACDANDNAMWNYYWRARLRRVSIVSVGESEKLQASRCAHIIANGLPCGTEPNESILASSVTAAATVDEQHLMNDLGGSVNAAQSQLRDDVNNLPTHPGGDKMLVH